MLQATGLSKFYGSVPAVQEVTFSLPPGQIIGYLGPNGSGKSTTVRMLTGLLRPTRGQVTYDGEDVHENLAGYRKHLGYVPEEANLYPYLTGKEYLEMVATLRAIPGPRQKSRINDLLELFSLWPHRDIALGSYSKGMRQRILLIASLLDNPDVLILDEPLSGLDVTSALIVKSLVQAAMPLDGVLLGLHGAMVAHDYDDVEGDIIERVRAIVGPRCVIGVELDPHCHLTVKRVKLSDIIILYKEFPHTDVVDRAEDLLTLVLRTIRGEVKPVMSMYDCRQIGSYPTTLPLMRGFVDRTTAMEGKDGAAGFQ